MNQAFIGPFPNPPQLVPCRFIAFVGLSFGRGVVLERVWRSRSMFRLQAVGDNKSPSVEACCSRIFASDTKTPSAARAPPPPGQPGQDASRSRWSGTRATESQPSDFPSHRRRSSSFQRRRKPAPDEEAPSTSQFLTGGRREQTLRMSLVSRSLMTRTVTL